MINGGNQREEATAEEGSNGGGRAGADGKTEDARKQRGNELVRGREGIV